MKKMGNGNNENLEKSTQQSSQANQKSGPDYGNLKHRRDEGDLYVLRKKMQRTFSYFDLTQSHHFKNLNQQSNTSEDSSDPGTEPNSPQL